MLLAVVGLGSPRTSDGFCQAHMAVISPQGRVCGLSDRCVVAVIFNFRVVDAVAQSSLLRHLPAIQPRFGVSPQ